VANYYPVSPRFWSTARRLQWDDTHRTLALYLLTCEHRNLEGLYRLPLAYIAADLNWLEPRVAAAMGRLERDDFIAYDHDAQVVFVKKALKWHQPKSERQLTGAINSLRSVPETPLLQALLDAADTHSEGYANAIREAFSPNLEAIRNTRARTTPTPTPEAVPTPEPTPPPPPARARDERPDPLAVPHVGGAVAGVVEGLRKAS
jgi:hypothetical protein